MNTNTEIKGFMARINEKKAAKGIMDEWGAFGYTMEEDEMIAEISDLRAALEAKQQALEAAQQVAASVHTQPEQDDIGKRLRRVAVAAGYSLEESDQFYYGCAFSILGRIADNLEQLNATLKVQHAIEPPSFSRDPDGDLALDWRVGDASLSVSFSTTGLVSWATGVEGKSACGSQQVAQRAGSSEAIGYMSEDALKRLAAGRTAAVLPRVVKNRDRVAVYTAPPAAVQPDSGRDAARYRELRDNGLFVVSASRVGWAIRRDEDPSTAAEMDAAMDEHMRVNGRAAQQGEQAPAAKERSPVQHHPV